MIGQEILRVLPRTLRESNSMKYIDFEEVREIRLRVGEYVRIRMRNGERVLRDNGYKRIQESEIKEVLEYMSQYSLYAYEQELRQGFLTLEGGHRVGVAGKVIVENERVKNFKYITSLNIRVAHQILDCGKNLLPYIVSEKKLCHTLIVSPPGLGKTTLLRDLIRLVSDGNEVVNGSVVGVIDERSEIGASYKGLIQNQIGTRTDILDACPKAEGMIMLIRSMGPEVIAVDEIGAKEDVHAIEYAMLCGCRLLATAHGSSMEELKTKPIFRELIKEKRFGRYVILGKCGQVGEVKEIFDERTELIYENTR